MTFVCIVGDFLMDSTMGNSIFRHHLGEDVFFIFLPTTEQEI